MNGAVAALSVDNGKVIDVEPMSRYCRGCAVNTRRLQDDHDALEVWRERHSGDCNLTCKGSAHQWKLKVLDEYFRDRLKIEV